MKTNRILLGTLALLFSLGGGTQLHAQNTIVTYQGRVTASGTNFTGAGQFKFAIVTSTNNSQQATATANVNNGFVSTYDVTFGGSGYVIAPAVTVSGGGGSGATAHAVISGGVVTSVLGDTAGLGYTSAPTVTIAPPPANVVFTTFWSNDGTSVNGSEPVAGVSVSVAGGLFTVALGDTTLANMMALDAALFTQPNLQLRIWFNDGVSGFAALSPVQNLTCAPYAAFSENAGHLLGSLPAAQISGAVSLANLPTTLLVTNGQNGVNLTGAFTGDGGGLTNLDSSNFWRTTGNAGTSPNGNFIGTSDGQPLEFKVNGARALRLEPNTNGAPNVIGGSPVNFVAPGTVGAVIAGGGTIEFEGEHFTNSVSADFGTIGGGAGNTIQTVAFGATIGGGGDNMIQIDAVDSTIGGGVGNKIQTDAFAGTISGGAGNTIQTNAQYSTIGGGFLNTNLGLYATVPGGRRNVAGMHSFAAGHRAKATHTGSFVWADSENTDFGTTAANQFLIRAAGGVGIGTTSPQAPLHIQASGQEIRLQGQLTGNANSAYIGFADGAGTDLGYVGDGSSGDNSMYLTSYGANVYLYTAFGATLTATPAGNVGIGTTTPNAKLSVNGTANNATGAWGVFSDRRLKENIEPLEAGSLDRLLRLKGVRYEYTRAELRDAYHGVHRGWVAQEVEEVFPDWVSEAPDGMKMVTPTGFNALTVEALRELRTEKDAAIQGLKEKLEARDQKLETENAELRQRLEKLERLMSEKNGGAK